MQALEPDHAVKLREHAVEVAGNVIPRVPDMARVEADADVLRQLHAVDDLAQLLKLSADLAALSGHRLQKHRCVHVRRENRV